MKKDSKNENIKKKTLSCKECCRQMKDYIDDKLSLDDDIVFVTHIRQCKDCSEELHNYFNFMTNLYYLNYGYSDRYPLSEEELLKATESVAAKYRKKRRLFIFTAIILILLIVVLLAFIIIRLGGLL